MSTSKKVVAMVYGVALLTVLSGCLKQTAESDRKGSTIPAQAEAESSLVPDIKTAETVAATDWQNYAGAVQFRYPQGWNVKTLAVSAGETISLRVLDTDKAFLWGSMDEPADYYVVQNGVKTVNTEKYADKYAFISVASYNGQSGKTWREFFDQEYSDVVAGYENVQLAFLPAGVEAVRATRISGVFTGSPRIFLKKGDVVYDVALEYRGEDEVQLQKVFNTFLQGFQF